MPTHSLVCHLAWQVPCAVCQHTLPGSKTLMIAGSRSCPNGFLADYPGWLFTSQSFRGDFICMDTAAEAFGSATLDNFHPVSPVEINGVSKQPSGYKPGYEVRRWRGRDGISVRDFEGFAVM